jgi:hypothetical protein
MINTAGFNLTYAGAITGPGTLTKSNAGTLTVGINNGAFSGPIVVNGGTLLAGASASLGNASAGNTLTLAGGTLRALGNIVGPTRNVIVSGGTIDTNGFDATFGNIDGTGAGALTKIGGGNLTANHVVLPGTPGNFVVNGGRVTIAPNGQAAGVSVFNTLALSAGATLDLNDNHLIDHATGTGGLIGSSNTYNGITGLIQSGRGSGVWDGTTGILTSQSQATTSSYNSIGVATAQQVKLLGSAGATAVWAGQTVTGSDTLVMFTYGGDANLDGKLNVDDYVRIDSNVGLGTAGWYNGDFNYDGKINVDDYVILDGNIGIVGPAFFTGSGAGGGNLTGAANLSGVTAVPEPTAISAIAFAGAAALTRRRRRRMSRN